MEMKSNLKRNKVKGKKTNYHNAVLWTCCASSDCLWFLFSKQRLWFSKRFWVRQCKIT